MLTPSRAADRLRAAWHAHRVAELARLEDAAAVVTRNGRGVILARIPGCRKDDDAEIPGAVRGEGLAADVRLTLAEPAGVGVRGPVKVNYEVCLGSAVQFEGQAD